MRTAHSSSASVGALLFVVAITVAVPRAAAQSLKPSSQRALAANVIVPQRRAFDVAQHGAVQITAVDVTVAIRQQVATTTMDISLANPLAGRRLEAELIVPVPDGAVVRGFTFQGAADEPTAEVLPKEQARRLYDSIVAKVRDPALLEFVGFNLVRSSVFPVEAGGTQKVRLIYEHLLPADGDRIDYLLPRSEALDYTVPWHITATITSDRPISTVYSPSHGLKTIKRTERSVTVAITTAARTEPGPFRMSFLLERNGVTASLFAYPDPQVGGGYFLLLAGLPAPKPQQGAAAIKRELTLVLDRSGSMNGKKLNQVRQAARQIIAGLEPGEFFNIITGLLQSAV
jgi:Ca-activated chloride channel family protein